MKIWLAKQGVKVLGKVADKVLKAREIKRLRDYVEKDNELDIKVRDLENENAILMKHIDVQNKKIDKYGKYFEELEKDVAILKKDSHPALFAKKDLKDILKRINKLEKNKEIICYHLLHRTGNGAC